MFVFVITITVRTSPEQVCCAQVSQDKVRPDGQQFLFLPGHQDSPLSQTSQLPSYTALEKQFTAMSKGAGLFLLDMMDVIVPDGSNDNQVGDDTEDGEAHV